MNSVFVLNSELEMIAIFSTREKAEKAKSYQQGEGLTIEEIEVDVRRDLKTYDIYFVSVHPKTGEVLREEKFVRFGSKPDSKSCEVYRFGSIICESYLGFEHAKQMIEEFMR